MSTAAQPHHRKIMICVDGSQDSTLAVKWAAKHILRSDDHVTLFMSYKEPAAATIMGATSMDGDYLAREKKEFVASCKAMVEELAEPVRAINLPYHIELMHGDPREEIVHFADDNEMELVIIGSRGRGTLKRAILGSVSDHVIHSCGCPVLVIRKQTIQEESL